MDDLIDRQAALDAMKDMYRAAEKWLRDATDDVTKARAESCMATLVEIKLRIDKTMGKGTLTDDDCMEVAKSVLGEDELPAAQPDHVADVSKKAEGDCISRQAAIDAIDRLDIPEDMCVFEILSHIELEIGTLPSKQPEIIRCNSCKYWTQSTGEMKGYGLGRCDFHDADLVACNGFCYWAERRTDE